MENDSAYQVTVIHVEINSIRQQLFYYDNAPNDGEIIALVRRWRELNLELRELGEDIET